MSKMTFISECGPTKITVETDSLYLPDLLDTLTGFLRASGYAYIEELQYRTLQDIKDEYELSNKFEELEEEEEESHE